MAPLIILMICFLPSCVLGKDYFTAAVFEHRPRAEIPSERDDPKESLLANLRFYEKAAQLAAENGADIIVFNEYGLIPYPISRKDMSKYAEHIPDPKKHVFNPCTEGSSDKFALQRLSCLAKDNDIYIVANILDTQPCIQECYADNVKDCDIKCPDDNVLIYNTNVAFNKEGTIVARYHKLHPYFEFVNTPLEQQFITFDTDFGRFGLIVCFDSVFKESYHLVKDYAVNTLIFPTYWYDDIEPLNAVEFQQAWALANNVHFLGANTQMASSGSLGSGIYSKDSGALVYTYDNDGESKLLLANLRIRGVEEIPHLSLVIVVREDKVFPKTKETGDNLPGRMYKESAGPPEDLYLDYRFFKSQTENYTLVKLQTPSGAVQSCNNGFCCSLKYSAENMEEDFYLAARNGSNNAENYYFWWEESCLLLRCDPFDGKECVIQQSKSSTVFISFELKAVFSAEQVFPAVTKDKFRLAPKTEWNYETRNSETVLKYQSDSKVPLLKAALLGRCYQRDLPYVPWF